MVNWERQDKIDRRWQIATKIGIGLLIAAFAIYTLPAIAILFV